MLSLSTVCVVCTLVADRYWTGGEQGSSNPVGWIGLLSCILVWGSYAVPVKAPEILKAKVDPMVYQVYFTIGGVTCGLVVAAALGIWRITYWGLFGAVLWVLNMIFSYLGIQGLGFAMAPAIWSGITVLMSFFLGFVVCQEPVKYIPVALASLLILTVGVAFVACCRDLRLQRFLAFCWKTHEEEMNLAVSFAPECELSDVQNEAGVSAPEIPKSTLMSLVFTVLVGFFNGSLMLPVKLYQVRDASQLQTTEQIVSYIVSFCLFSIPVTFVLFLGWFYFPPLKGFTPKWNFRVAAFPGFVTGFSWLSAFLCASFGTRYLGQVLGYPLSQCALILNCLWGIFYFRELQGKKTITTFLVGFIVLLAGALGLVLST